MNQPQQRPNTVDQPSPRSPRHRSVSNETIMGLPKPHPQQPKESSPLHQAGSTTNRVRRYQSDNALTPKQDAGLGGQVSKVQRRAGKGSERSSSPSCPRRALLHYRSSGGAPTGSPQGAVRGETPAAGQLKLPSIVSSSQQADPVLLGNQRSKSGSQIMSPTFIKRLNPGTGGGGVSVGGVG